MKVYLATDHTGVDLKNKMKAFLETKGFEVIDCGAYELDKNDDYPDFIAKAARAVSQDPGNARGIIFGGSGQGEAMAANKFHNVRCAVFYTLAVPVAAADVSGRMSADPFEIIKLSREHNNANMLSLSTRFLKEEDAMHAAVLWLETVFPGEERHARRIEKIRKIEEAL
jgi:ribose 5-phosphate isomerase B